MSNGHKFDHPSTYHIRVKGRLEKAWSHWFDGFDIEPNEDDETWLTGQVADQSALHGVLYRIRDLGLPLLLVKRIEDDDDEDPG
jgi:hypothetical protein